MCDAPRTHLAETVRVWYNAGKFKVKKWNDFFLRRRRSYAPPLIETLWLRGPDF